MAKYSIKLFIDAIVNGAKDVLGLSKEVDRLDKESREASKQTDKLAGSLGRVRAVSGKVATALRLAGAALAARAFAKTTAEVESLNAGFKAVFGSAKAAADEMDYVSKVANRLGISTGVAAKSYLDLAAASKGTALEGQQTRDIFEAVTLAMGKLGKSSADTEGALLAIQQMMSKGRVSSEELRQQLGERLPGAFQLAAKSMGVTTAELDKMLQRGQLVAEDLLPRLANELTTAFDDGGQINTLTASWNRLTNSIRLFTVEAGKNADSVSLMNQALQLLTTGINFVNVGLTSVVQYSKAAGTAFYEFIRLISFTRSWDDFKKNVDDAFLHAQNRIAESADKVFGLDRSLQRAGASAEKAAASMAKMSAAAAQSSDAILQQANASVVLVQQLEAIDTLLQNGIITEQQAIANKKALNDAYQESLPVITRTKAEMEALQGSLEKYVDSAKTAAELDHVQAVAMRELNGNAEALGAVMERVTLARMRLAVETKKTALAQLESVRADVAGAKSSFDLALAMVQLIEQKKKLNQLLSDGVISQKEYAGQLKDLQATTEKLKQAQQELADTQKAVSGGAEAMADSTGKAGERVKIFNETIGDTSTIMQKMIAHLQFWRAEMDGLSETARSAFDGMVDAINRAGGALVTSFDASAKAAQDNSAEIAALSQQIDHMRSAYNQATGDVNRWMIAVEAAGLAVKRSFLQQEDAAAALERRIASLKGLTEEQAVSLQQAANSFTLLDQTRLDGIKSQIEQLRQATEALNDSALATLTSLQNELDRLNGNFAAIEQRNYELKRLELLEQINAAQAAGDAEAIARLQQALVLLDKIHKVKMANLNADIEASKVQPSSAATASSGGGSSQFTSGGTSRGTTSVSGNVETTINLDGKQIAKVMQPYLTEFGRLSG